MEYSMSTRLADEFMDELESIRRELRDIRAKLERSRERSRMMSRDLEIGWYRDIVAPTHDAPETIQ
jgi:hypothetical protein